MAGSCACHSSLRKLLSAGEDELASDVPTEGNCTLTPTPVVLFAPTPAPVTAPATALSSDKKLFKQFMKAYLEV